MDSRTDRLQKVREGGSVIMDVIPIAHLHTPIVLGHPAGWHSVWERWRLGELCSLIIQSTTL